MKKLLYSASDIAMILYIYDIGMKLQVELLEEIWKWDRMFLQEELSVDKKKLFTEVENQCHYCFDKEKMDSEFPVISKDMSYAGMSFNIEEHINDFDNIDIFFKNLRYRLLFFEEKGYVRMKLRTLMRAYGYKRRSPQLVDYLRKCLYFYHIQTFKRGNVECDIAEESLDTMITFRIC